METPLRFNALVRATTNPAYSSARLSGMVFGTEAAIQPANETLVGCGYPQELEFILELLLIQAARGAYYKAVRI